MLTFDLTAPRQVSFVLGMMFLIGCSGSASESVVVANGGTQASAGGTPTSSGGSLAATGVVPSQVGGTPVVTGGSSPNGSGGTTVTGAGGNATGGVSISTQLGPGGTVSNGGAVSTGGSLSTGGTTSRGGTPSTGGSVAAGGTESKAGASAGGSTNPSGPAAITATKAAAAMGKGFNLGQMFESTQHDRTLAVASAKIDAYYAKGFRNVRIPITWTEVVGGDRLVNDPAVGAVNRTHARLKVITQVVDYALGKADLYVVINAHHETTLKTESRSAVLERLWADIADIFATRDHRLLFEILNEPHRSDSATSAMPAADLRSMTAKAYAKIRAVDASRIVLIGGNQWFGASEMATVWPNLDGVGGGSDPYVMATFHHYDPWTFCGDSQGAYNDAWTDSNLSTPMDTMRSWANSVGKGMPVFIGEWGVAWASRSTTMDCNNIRSWYQKFHSQNASPKGIPNSVWDDGGWFKIFDHSTNSWNNNLIDCIGGTCSWTGTDRFAGCT